MASRLGARPQNQGGDGDYDGGGPDGGAGNRGGPDDHEDRPRQGSENPEEERSTERGPDELMGRSRGDLRGGFEGFRGGFRVSQSSHRLPLEKPEVTGHT